VLFLSSFTLFFVKKSQLFICILSQFADNAEKWKLSADCPDDLQGKAEGGIFYE
jgi:hypothetical protein